MSDDDKLAAVSYVVDDFLKDLVERSGLDPLSISAIILARIVLMNQYVGTADDVVKLMKNAADVASIRQTQETIQ